MLAAHNTWASLHDHDNNDQGVYVPVQGWVFIDNEGYPLVPLLDRLVTLKPGVDNYSLFTEGFGNADYS